MDKDTKKTAEQKKLSGKWIGSLVALVVLLIIAGIAIWKLQPKKNVGPVSSGETSDVQMMEFETPYGTLKYPATYEDVVVCEDTKEGDALTKAFYSTVFGEQVPLFTVYFQQPETGVLLGYLKQDGENIAVSITVSEEEPPSDGTDAQKDKYYCMLDGVNEMISSITMFEGFKAEK